MTAFDFAHADDAAAKTEGDSIGADEAGTLVPQAEADEAQQSGDAAATGDFSTDEDQQAATEWQTLANQLGTPWAEEQAGEASVEASWSAAEAQNYEDYVTKLGTAETAYATSDATQFTNEVTAIDAADQTDGDAAADADQTLTNTLADDETAVEQSAAGADSTYWVATAQANHDYRIAAAQASHDVLVGGSFAGYNTAMSAAATSQSLALNGAITQFHATVDPVVAITGQSDIDATLTHDTSIANLSLDDFTKTTQAQNTYSDLESGDYDTQQQADNQASHDLTVADANAEASAMASFAQANPSPWANEAAAEAQAKATQTIAAADAELTLDNQAADAQSAQEIAQSDAAAKRDIAYATRMHDQTVAMAQKVHDLSKPTGVSVPDAITPPDDGTPPTLAADYGGGFEAGNLWLPDTTEDFTSLPLQVPSGGEMEEPDAGGLVTDMILGAMEVNGRRPYTTMLYGTIDLSAPLPFSIPGYYFFDSVSLDATPLYGGANPNQSLPPGSAQAIASANWWNGQPATTSTANQPGPSGPSFFGQQSGGSGGYVPGGAGGSTGGGGTVVAKPPQQEQGPSSAQAPPPDTNEGINRLAGESEEGNTARQGLAKNSIPRAAAATGEIELADFTDQARAGLLALSSEDRQLIIDFLNGKTPPPDNTSSPFWVADPTRPGGGYVACVPYYRNGKVVGSMQPIGRADEVSEYVPSLNDRMWAALHAQSLRSGIPTGLLTFAQKNGYTFASIDTSSPTARVKGGVISFDRATFDAILSGRGVSTQLAMAFNELMNAYLLERDGGGVPWMQELLASEGYVSSGWYKQGGSTALVEEAMSEIAALAVTVIGTLKSQGRTASFDKNSFSSVDFPSHDDEGDAFASLPRHGPEGARGTRDRVSAYIIYLTLWIIENGDKDPVPGGTMKDRIAALTEWFERTQANRAAK